MPKWALDPLLTESSPLQTGRGTEGHGAVDGVDEPDSEADYDSDFSDEDMGRVSFTIRGRMDITFRCLIKSFHDWIYGALIKRRAAMGSIPLHQVDRGGTLC